MWVLALAACELLQDTDRYLTEVSDLRIVGLVLEPPEVRPNDTVRIESHIADPQGKGFDLMLWTCVPFDGGCLESLLDVRPTVVRDADWTLPLVNFARVPVEVGNLLVVPGIELTVLVWALACEPGLCPLIDEVDDALIAPFPDWDPLYARLAQPDEEIRHLPFAGVNLAARRLFVSLETDESERNQNPTYTVLQGASTNVLQGGQRETWNLRVVDRQGDRMHAYGFSTAGEITDRQRVTGNEVEITWTTPENLRQDHVRIWIVIEEEDEGNGSAILTADFVR